jgi:hypothetical protein
VQRNHPNEHHCAQTKHEPKHCQQCRRNCAHLIHPLNLRPPIPGSNKILVIACSSGRQSAPSSCETRRGMSCPHGPWPLPLRRRRRGRGPGWGGVNWRGIQLAASQSRYFLFPALNGRTINSGVS